MTNTTGFTVLLLYSAFVGESPPPPPRVCFGRDELVGEVVSLAENLEPIALIGAGGIGKTSLALTVLHHDRIKERFGENRRFIRCDQFPASPAHFLARLSRVIGAGTENPEDLTPLRPLLSSKEMLIILDNAESVLDAQGQNAREIYTIVNELCQFRTICLFITSRITTVPHYCKRPEIPTLSMEAACDIFYGIYGGCGRSETISNILRQLDFHALSITLLATTASHHMWDHDELAKKWNIHRARALRTDYNESLATTIELSLTSPTFGKLGSTARELLGVVAFFPQGIDKNNLDWLFPTIPDREDIFHRFCVLSLTYRSNGFITMLAPIRDYLAPADPKSSPLLCVAKDQYTSRLSVDLEPDKPGFGEARWIRSEDINVEHLLDVFTSVDRDSTEIWDACRHFMRHLYWHKPRLTVLGRKIEGLPDDHPSKTRCLTEFALLFEWVGNHLERKRLLTHALKRERDGGNDVGVACTLRRLADANRMLGLHEEGIQRSKEALGIYERLGDAEGQAACLSILAWCLHKVGQDIIAEEAAYRAINLPLGQGQEFWVCISHRVLGGIYYSKGEREKSIHHHEVALRIASSSNWHNQQFRIHLSLAVLRYDKNEFDNAHSHIEQAKLHAVDNAYCVGVAMEMQARIWYHQHRLDGATTGALCALENFEKLGATKELGRCKTLLREIELAADGKSTSGELDSGGELLGTILCPIHPTNCPPPLLGACRIVHPFHSDTVFLLLQTEGTNFLLY